MEKRQIIIREAEELQQLLAAFQFVPCSLQHHCMLHRASPPPTNIHLAVTVNVEKNAAGNHLTNFNQSIKHL